jgi:hypothetical protein
MLELKVAEGESVKITFGHRHDALALITNQEALLHLEEKRRQLEFERRAACERVKELQGHLAESETERGGLINECAVIRAELSATLKRVVEYNGETRRLRMELDAAKSEIEEVKTTCMVVGDTAAHVLNCGHFAKTPATWRPMVEAIKPTEGHKFILYVTKKEGAVRHGYLNRYLRWDRGEGKPDEFWCRTFFGGPEELATHWMPLPEPPK